MDYIQILPFEAFRDDTGYEVTDRTAAEHRVGRDLSRYARIEGSGLGKNSSPISVLLRSSSRGRIVVLSPVLVIGAGQRQAGDLSGSSSCAPGGQLSPEPSAPGGHLLKDGVDGKNAPPSQTRNLIHAVL
ncbi:hypothetical protein AGR6A_pAt40003 [Agrobacterium sp. NCPPB 925]|nr:hypothetical protein AGR6A_pAt40003 [Agrobacterium sp. NCPPB 925]